MAAQSSSSPIIPDKVAPNKGIDDLWMIKIDSNGSKIWDQTYGGDSIELIGSIFKNDKYIYILGTSESSLNGDRTDQNKGVTDAWVVKTDTLGNKLWAKSYGGDTIEQFFHGIAISDQKLLFAGYTTSHKSGDIKEDSRGYWDAWLVCTDTAGTIIWERRYGGNSTDNAWCVKKVADNEVLVGGFTASDQGFEVSSQPHGITDGWLVKIDTLGNKIWDRRYGGEGYQEIRWIEQTKEGDYILGGFSDSPPGGNKTSANYGDSDIWLIKTDQNGNVIWDKSYGGSDSDGCNSLIIESKGNYIINGYSRSNNSGIKTTFSKGDLDIWLLGIDKNGDILWQKTIGGNRYDGSNMISYCSKNEYLLSGESYSDIGEEKSEANRGGEDVWLIKIGFPDPMSLDLLQLTGTYQWGFPLLRWKDVSNDSTLFYVIEKSVDIRQGFEIIDTVPALSALEYRYEDRQKIIRGTPFIG